MCDTVLVDPREIERRGSKSYATARSTARSIVYLTVRTQLAEKSSIAEEATGAVALHTLLHAHPSRLTS